MSIYLISNRATELKDKERFKNDGREHALPKFRVAKCTVGKNQKQAKYEILPDQYPAGYETVIEALDDPEKANSLTGTSRMFYELYNQMLNDKGRKSDVLIFIHGFANSFEDNLEHIVTLKNTFLDPENSTVKHLIYIAWPTRSSMFLTYWNDQKDARETGRVLARVYEKLLDFFILLFNEAKKENCNNKIHLAVHSMGNQVLKHMLQNIQGQIYPFFDQVLLFHSDVENTVFEPGEPFTKLESLAGRTHIYIHKDDKALWISRFTKNLNKRLGKRGPKNIDNLNDETFIIDVTKLTSGESFREQAFDHWGYIESSYEIKDILQVLNGDDIEDFPHRIKLREKYYSIRETED